VRWSAWNLLLFLPLLMLITPWYNRVEPRLFGMPFLYWSQFGWILVAVLCTTVVHRMTRRNRTDRTDQGAGR
jgi:uncharacterized membrane protein